MRTFFDLKRPIPDFFCNLTDSCLQVIACPEYPCGCISYRLHNRLDWEDYQEYFMEVDATDDKMALILKWNEKDKDIQERGMFSYHSVDVSEDGWVHIGY